MWILGLNGLNSGIGLTNSVKITNGKVMSQRINFTFRQLYKNS